MKKHKNYSTNQKETLKRESFHSKINSASGLPDFTERQVSVFNSNNVDSYDEALRVLDEDVAEKNPL